jgi:transcriptional regulator, propionate catabolism operon regulatory protein
MSSAICFVSLAPAQTEHFKQALSSLPEPPRIIETTFDREKRAVSSALKQGAEIFVAGEYNALYLQKKLNVTVVPIPLTGLDVAQAVHRARNEYGMPIALLEFYHSANLAPIKEILGCEIKQFVFRNERDCREKLERAGMEHCRAAVIRGTIPEPRPGTAFIPCFPLLSTAADILFAFRQAEQIARVRQIDRHEAMKFKSVVQFSFTGIVVTDEENRIIVFNSAAERMFGINETRALGRPIVDVIPQGPLLRNGDIGIPQIEEIKVLGQKQLMVNRIPILEKKQIFGVIYTLQEVHKIQSMEEKIRRAAHSKGLYARMTFHSILGESSVTRDTVSRAKKFAASDETILITGESGTGKEIFAQSIHNESRRRNQPFVAVNCAAIPSTLLESELFGYAGGAFTGARRGGKQGVFELAHGGTIFLDEIAELPPPAQGHLLRVLQEKEVMRVGDGKITPVDVRVIAATNQRLEDAIQLGLFRWDLYYRLNVLRLELPPLREHSQDVLTLAQAFIETFCPNPSGALAMKQVFKKYKDFLEKYKWPGNVRELQNLIKRAVASLEAVKAEDFEVEIKVLIDELASNSAAFSETLNGIAGNDLRRALKHMESEFIRHKYDGSRGSSKKDLAKKLGISRSTLWRKFNRD